MQFKKTKLAALFVSAPFWVYANQSSIELTEVTVTAEEQLKQSLGVTKLPAEEIKKREVTNDVSELVRKMPGVNLTGNTATGQRGNNRQIDIRGMGPENTLILVDGKPVTSRNSVRYSWRGQRDTRGDSNWVPVEQIESIEVLRGPSAARYGSGAAGGVVNIITKKADNKFGGSVSFYTNQPKDSKEGATNRLGFSLHGPLINEKLSFRVYGNVNKTDSDALDINNTVNSVAAGREGVRNRDIAGRLTWKITPEQILISDISYSRQGNIYAGDVQNNNPTIVTNSLYGSETNRMYRQSYSLIHEGKWSWGTSKITGNYDRTTNARYMEGLAGGPEGRITNDLIFSDSLLKSSRIAGEISIPVQWHMPQVWTLGVEFGHDSLDDPASLRQALNYNFTSYQRPTNSKMKQDSFSAFIENNLLVANDKVSVVPAVRFDHNSRSGGKVSPALNIFYYINEKWTAKGGIAQAYKAPNLYQSSPGYLLFTNGNGCPIYPTAINQCYLIGNANLKPETSINKEIGIEYKHHDWNFAAAYFHNDYRNKIAAGNTILESGVINGRDTNLLQWSNIPKAIVEGFEGSVTIPMLDNLLWTNNFTYILQSKDKSTGNPLSIIPKYTINTFLDWQISEKWNSQLNATFYGRQKPRQFAENNTENRAGISTSELGSYTTVGVNVGYKINKNIDIRVGITNLFDKKLYRSNEGASTYNEAGTAYYGKLNVSF